MFDRAAAIIAAREALDNAPRVDIGGVSEPVVDIAALVDAVTKAGNPDALVIPAYDEPLALFARFRLEQDTPEAPGATLTPTAGPGVVKIAIVRDGKTIVAGLTSNDMAWHAGLALCSAALESRRLHEEAGS